MIKTRKYIAIFHKFLPFEIQVREDDTPDDIDQRGAKFVVDHIKDEGIVCDQISCFPVNYRSEGGMGDDWSKGLDFNVGDKS